MLRRSALLIGLLSLAVHAEQDAPKSPPQDPPAVVEETQAPDDPDTQAKVDKGAAELEAVRKAEEKAGFFPPAPGAGPRDSLTVGLGGWNPLARDLDAALGGGVDGAPLAEPHIDGGGLLSLPELAGISPEELRAKYDIPVELNDAVVAYIRFFQTDARPHFERWLARSSRWTPLMRQILEKNGVPLDLVYLSMIESGYNAYAYSFAKASGLWQFMVGTSRRYGLVTDFWVDERRDPLKATQAAALYLADLRERFHGDWYLAWAGYNAGEGKIDKAIRKESTVDFWRMMEKGRTLRAETKHYVPKLIAAALISKHPERFGFSVQPEPLFEFDTAEIPTATDLRVLAQAAGTTVDELRSLNPELRRFCTPPTRWTVRLPKGSRETFLANFEKVGPSERLTFAEHKVEKGEPLAKIAKAYGVAEQAILRTNGLKSVRQIKVGRTLVIPLQGTRGLARGETLADRKERVAIVRSTPSPAGRASTAAPSAAYTAVAEARARALANGKADPAEKAVPVAARSTKYKVKRGDSLAKIASRFNTSIEELRRRNGLRRKSVQAGQVLVVGDES